MKVAEYLEKHRVPYHLIPHREAFDAQRMAHVLHVPGQEVAKTVLLRANGGYVYVVAIVPASKVVDFHKVSQVLGGCKLQLATEVEIAERCPDCEFGVLPPFGSQYGMKTIVDESLTQDDEIVFEGSTHREAIRMKFSDFQQMEEPLVAPIAR